MIGLDIHLQFSIRRMKIFMLIVGISSQLGVNALGGATSECFTAHSGNMLFLMTDIETTYLSAVLKIVFNVKNSTWQMWNVSHIGCFGFFCVFLPPQLQECA